MFPGALLALSVALAGQADVTKPKRLLLVTHSLGFIHDSVGTAEDVLKQHGPSRGYEVTAWRYTGDPADPKFPKYAQDYRARTGKPVDPEHCGRVNKETLKQFDAVLFFTTGNPLTKAELADLIDWVKAGGAFAGTHCASDTLYGENAYGLLVGAYFRGHLPGYQKFKFRLEDAMHPAAAGFAEGMPYEDEVYIFRDAPYSRERLHIIASAADFNPVWTDPKDPKKKVDLSRKDNDYAIAWCREEGKGKVFYTALGHKKEVWKDDRFQHHLFGGLDWAVGRKPGDASPTGKK